MRILAICDLWIGSTGHSCLSGLRQLGHEVSVVDVRDYYPSWKRLGLRLSLRLVGAAVLDEFNRLIVATAEMWRPHLTIIFKGTYVRKATIQQLKGLGSLLVNHYPDTSIYTHGKLIPESIPEYDYVFVAKGFQVTEALDVWGARRAFHIPHGFDLDLHRPGPVVPHLASDICFIATYTEHKERFISGLLDCWSSAPLTIYGASWRRARDPRVKRLVKHVSPFGELYSAVIRSAAINLAIMSGPVVGSSQGDETTTRTFEIPACRGFMIHEHTPELRKFFVDQEVPSFTSGQELSDLLQFYHGDPQSRQIKAEAAFVRCVPHYSYRQRMKDLLDLLPEVASL